MTPQVRTQLFASRKRLLYCCDANNKGCPLFVGFNIIDVFAWGAIGHALGYAALAIISLNTMGVNPAPKF